MSPFPSVSSDRRKRLSDVTKRFRLHRALTQFPGAPRAQRSLSRVPQTGMTPPNPRRLLYTRPTFRPQRPPRQRTQARTLGMQPGNNGGLARALYFRNQAIDPFTPSIRNRRAPRYRRTSF